MINTKPTSNHIKSIKNYKKFLEKWDMWDFAYYDGSEYYFLTQYISSIKGISGYLILDSKGEVVPFIKAKEYLKYLINYNTLMSNTISGILPQMKKNMSPYKEKIQLLTKYQQAFYNLSPGEAESVGRIINETNQILEIPNLLNSIYYKLGDYQRIITTDQGYFDLDLLGEIKDTFNQYREVMYKYGIRERALMKDYETVLDSLKKVEEEVTGQDQRKIKNLLTASIQSNQGALEKSMREFEYDDKGNKVFIDQTRIKESLGEKVEKEGAKHFEKKVLSILRNPK